MEAKGFKVGSLRKEDSKEKLFPQPPLLSLRWYSSRLRCARDPKGSENLITGAHWWLCIAGTVEGYRSGNQLFYGFIPGV